jgi:Reverse transcriptase (RNA-dependent DNA polymerase)
MACAKRQGRGIQNSSMTLPRLVTLHSSTREVYSGVKRTISKCFLLIYVDDILLLVLSHDASKYVKEEIASLYTIKDLEEANYFLGIKLDRNSNVTLRMSQTNYIENILERFNMTASKPVSSPMVPNKNIMEQKPIIKEDASSMISVPYREAIGALLYLSIRTRPDIAVAVGTLEKHVQEPHSLHCEGVKRILRYLQGTRNKALGFRTKESTNPQILTVYADADWGTDPNESYSRTGIVCQLGANTVWWNSRKQNSIAVSNCEAEYMALFDESKDIFWLRNLLREFGMCQGHTPTLMYSDNQGSTAWATVNSLRKVNHVDLRYHFTNMLIVANQGRAVGLYRGRKHGHCEPRVQHRRRRDCMWGYFGSRMAERERESYRRIDGKGGSNVARVRSDFSEGIA